MNLLRAVRRFFTGRDARDAAIAFAVSWWACLVGGLVGLALLPARPQGFHRLRGPDEPLTVWHALVGWDGMWYWSLAEEGYPSSTPAAAPSSPSRAESQPASVTESRRGAYGFFPALPLAARCLAAFTGLPVPAALLLVSNACFFLSLVAISRLYRDRVDDETRGLLLWLVALWPIGVFFHIGYPESLFLLLSLSGYALLRQGRTFSAAWVAGAVTAVRPTGVALAPVVLGDLFCQTSSWRARLAKVSLAAVGAVWGLALYAGWLGFACGSPWLFVDAQRGWDKRPDGIGWSLLWLQPVWSQIPRAASLVWDEPLAAATSLALPNLLIWLLTVGLLIDGGVRKVVDRRELAIGGLLLAIPYVLKAGTMEMAGQARYCLVCWPAFVVLADRMRRLPLAVRRLVLAACGAALGWYYGCVLTGQKIF
jgi:hypothetical protein